MAIEELWYVHFHDGMNDRSGKTPGYKTREEAMLAACPYYMRPNKTLTHVSGPRGLRVSDDEVREFCMRLGELWRGRLTDGPSA